MQEIYVEQIGMIIPSVFGYGKLNAKMDFVIEELAEQREIHKVTNDKLFLIEKNQILYSFKIEDTTERCDILEQYHNWKVIDMTELKECMKDLTRTFNEKERTIEQQKAMIQSQEHALTGLKSELAQEKARYNELQGKFNKINSLIKEAGQWNMH